MFFGRNYKRNRKKERKERDGKKYKLYLCEVLVYF